MSRRSCRDDAGPTGEHVVLGEEGPSRLAAITQPTLVASGDNDTMMITENSHLPAQHLPNAQLRICPDAGHGFLNQYPEQFGDHVRALLNGG